MHEKNLPVKDRIKKSGFRMYEIAKVLQISQHTLSTWMREPLTTKQKTSIITALKILQQEQKAAAKNAVEKIK